MISRFNKKVQASRVILEVRNRRYFKRKPTKRQQRMAAMMRTHYRTLRQKMSFY
jgi:ribosomal protein S21